MKRAFGAGFALYELVATAKNYGAHLALDQQVLGSLGRPPSPPRPRAPRGGSPRHTPVDARLHFEVFKTGGDVKSSREARIQGSCQYSVDVQEHVEFNFRAAMTLTTSFSESITF